ncbi:receptor-type tyrosine-protein phosphatase N2 isoform X2 [Drosophila novamexicana]|uniref:receptor-type tyrosine-protein phosphatase N2 isoform X2 n=1 Tax=Drosophila novamexicana TaxID=47314 RepID=UPI0011E5EB3B|nr:receptor-type tyrosine-protein phosphatase N2 isoform X2 [Drosophila novamexicana]
MPKCSALIMRPLRTSNCGGPIIMASNVQQQQQQRQQHTTTRAHQQQQQQQPPEATTSAADNCEEQHEGEWSKLRQQQQQQQQLQQEEQQQQQQQQQQQEQQQQQLSRRAQAASLPSQRRRSRRRLLNGRRSAASTGRGCGLSRLCCKLDVLRQSARQLQFASLEALLLLLFLALHGDTVQAEGNVGCQFVRTLCIPHSEVCYDDNIFGKCIPTTGVDVEDIERTPLTEEQSRLLATMLEELQGAGLGWDHHYVQCRIQGALFSLQRQQQLPPNLCANLAPAPPEYGDPASALAYVRFTPPEPVEQLEANVDYYEQLLPARPAQFYPTMRKKQPQDSGFNSILHQLQLQDRRRLRHDPLELEHFGKLDGHTKSTQLELPSVMDAFLDTERQRIEREQQLRLAEQDGSAAKVEQQNRLELYQILADSEPDPQPYQRKPQPANAMDQLEAIVEKQQHQQHKQQQQQQEDQPQAVPVYLPEELNESSELYFPDNYAPLKRRGQQQPVEPPKRSFFRELANEQGLPQEPLVELAAQPQPELMKRRPELSAREQQELAFESSLRRNSLTPLEEEAMLASNSYPRALQNQRVFTEGGMLLVPQEEEQQQLADSAQADEPSDIKQTLLANMLGFARHERLDVKKPGPQLGPPAELSHQLETEKPRSHTEDVNKEVMPAHVKGGDVNEPYKKKKLVNEQHSDEDHAPHTVDTEYAHVFVKNPIDSWYDGQRIMNELAQILHMQGYFSYLTVQPHEVSFRVDSNNPERKTAADVARYINENRGVKNNIQRRVGFYVLHAGVGDRVKDLRDPSISASRIELAEQGPDVTHIMAYMFAGAGAAAVIVIFVTLILIKRHDRKRDKLGGLQSGMSGAESCSKDYQELCRARMAGKNGNTATGNAGNGGGAGGAGGSGAAGSNTTEQPHSGRIMSLSKENEGRPPSSRSSTSSWSEEPALTNMDISTGHMVLSYMEDHLRNKGRLQREWEALCRYEAEPSARDAASQPQCVNLNRPGAPLPYDHSRVVLNHLANAEGLDYVNASTITDHDPRAPAYVAAQGPLPSTLAHFWQMIWEQGAVVIVALCRLQENGEVACARYWPEEGAEVYHIYEVHLVSEHIWCDDYLVRSFYLKNLRTSETRTVTQFHFLSWPQMGVPPQAKALLDFRRKVNKSYRGRSCPIVVHGSAGAGRTGSYILLDLVLGRMNKGAREIDIAATLEHLRDQRAGVVATRQQFEFVLMAVAEEVHAILKALPANTSGEKRELDKESGGAATTKEPLKEDKAQEAAEEEAPTSSSKAAAAAAAKEKEQQKEKEKEQQKEKQKEQPKVSVEQKTPAAKK